MVTKNAYFSLLTHIKQLLSVTLCDTIAGIVKWDRTEWTDVKVEILMEIRTYN